VDIRADIGADEAKRWIPAVVSLRSVYKSFRLSDLANEVGRTIRGSKPCRGKNFSLLKNVRTGCYSVSTGVLSFG
jgi:hypothetical protein